MAQILGWSRCHPVLSPLQTVHLAAIPACIGQHLGGTVRPVLSGHSKIDNTKILMTNGSLMKVKSIAECSPLVTIGLENPFFVFLRVAILHRFYCTVNNLKFPTLFYFSSQINCWLSRLEFTKHLSEYQTEKTLIRQLLQKQSHLGLHHLLLPFRQETSVGNYLK